MSDLNSIDRSNDYPADGHGYVPTRGKSDRPSEEENAGSDEPAEKDIVEASWNLASKLRDYSTSMNSLQSKLIAIPETDTETREPLMTEIKKIQIAMENLCSLGDFARAPQENLDMVSNLLKKADFNPSSLAVTKLLEDD
jgi:hypothetical protein